MSGLIAQFGIDWKLLIAQAVNFGVLIFVLTKFAYRPIIAMLAKRRHDIEQGIRFAKEAQEAFMRADQAREEKLASAHAEALAIVSKAEHAASVRKDEIVAEAAKKSEEIVDGARRTIRQEKAGMMEQAYGEAEEMVEKGIARVLGKMPPARRDLELIRDAIQELKAAQS